METCFKIVAEQHPADHTITLLLNGKFGEDALPELAHSISEARCGHQRIYLDLSEVTLLDRKAAEYFSQQAGPDLKLVNCPIYLRRWITKVTDDSQ